MIEQMASASIDKKLDFLRNVLEAAEKRRNSVENKSSIMIAANAVLLTVIISLGLPRPFINYTSIWLWFRFSLAFISLGGIAISSLCAVQVLTNFGSKWRRKVMKVSANEFNLFYVGKIAEYESAKSYLFQIESLTEERILEQLANQGFNLSRLVMNRYKWFERSQLGLIISILASIVLALTGLS